VRCAAPLDALPNTVPSVPGLEVRQVRTAAELDTLAGLRPGITLPERALERRIGAGAAMTAALAASRVS
jgi:hypothetical protein